eukprot:jgi/Mesvir1/21464/Mv03920-RA.1
MFCARRVAIAAAATAAGAGSLYVFPAQAQTAGASPPESSYNGLKLLQVHVFFRHGDRSPVTKWPGEEHHWTPLLQLSPNGVLEARNYASGSDPPFGQLTQRGAAQALSLGRHLRERYERPLGLDLASLTEPTPEISIRSTGYLRTCMTGFYVLAGLYGSEDMAVKVPLETRSLDDENMYAHTNGCSRMKQIFKVAFEAMRSHPLGTEEELPGAWRHRFRALQEDLEQRLDIHVPHFPWLSVADLFQCKLANDIEVPPTITQQVLDEIRNNLSKDWAHVFKDQESCQLGIGRLMAELGGRMEQRVHHKGGNGLKMALYSGHDTTLMPLLVCTGLFDGAWPDYAAWVAVELWSTDDEKEHFVRALYNGRELKIPQSLDALPEEDSLIDTNAVDRTDASGHSPYTSAGYGFTSWSTFKDILGWSAVHPEEYTELCVVNAQPEFAGTNEVPDGQANTSSDAGAKKVADRVM